MVMNVLLLLRAYFRPYFFQTENEHRFELTHVTWVRKAVIRLPGISIELRKRRITLVRLLLLINMEQLNLI